MTRAFGSWAVFISLLLSTGVTFAQREIPKGYFRSPLDIRLFITGTFAETRPDHMHSGLDFGSGQEAGQPVYAMADGYVSRIKVSPYGYGKVIYLTHPNGYVSVYAHLNEFNVVINDYVIRKQYAAESHEIELFPDPRLFPLNKGDIVGYTGNTGSSTGPHLHLEIRSGNTERPLNPALFGIYASDPNPPVIRKLMIYPYGPGSTVNEKDVPVIYTFDKNATNKTYTLPDTVRVKGSCYLGAIIRDFVSSTSNDAGIYSLRMLVDSQAVFSYQLDSFAFDETRYVNDLIDYKEYLNSGERYLLLKASPGNTLSFLSYDANRGILTADKPYLRQIQVIAADYTGNKAVLRFMISFGEIAGSIAPQNNSGTLFNYDRENTFERSDLKIEIPKGSLFNNIYFTYQRSNNTISPYGELHQIHTREVPLIKPFLISIKATAIPDSLRSKIIIARVESGNRLVALTSEFIDGWIRARSNRFGNFVLVADTSVPKIKPMNYDEGKSIAGRTELRTLVSDELSGIKSYRAEINSKWVLGDYDAKNDLLIIPLSADMAKGPLELRIIITDACGNKSLQVYHLLN